LKSDMSRRYHTRVVTNILYSAVISCLVEIFLVTNVSMIARYMEESGRMNRLLQAVLDYHVAVVLVYVVSGLVLFAVTFMILQEPYIRYISNISDAVQSISEGNLNTTIDVIGDDEFSSMAANLNKMVEDIRELMDKERESERTKNELITNVAHDLRTPLTSIIGYLELLAGNSKIPEQMQHKYIEIAYGKARRLEKLIEDLFGFTKLNYGRISMHVSQLDVVKLLGQLLEEAYPNFVEKNLSYDLQSNVPVKIITADGNLLARLFDNLIGNAIKYGADGKRVLVKILAQEDVVTVSITNYGYVIPPEELPLIFNKFYRVEQSRSSSTGGTGLGLAIAKEIVDMHGGTINVTSDLDGTVFTVKLQVNFDINSTKLTSYDYNDNWDFHVQENFGTIS
jgi:two-component system sensor histidine kinase VanS